MRTTKRQTPPIERLAYSPGELAKAIGISKTYAYTLVRNGRIKSIRVGSRWLVPVREVEAFLAKAKEDEQQ
jgi:excisionase family DNA binding protein